MNNTSEPATIAITSYSIDSIDDHTNNYISGVERANGLPWVILPEHDVNVDEFITKAGALVLTGGEDIHPSRYGSKPLETRR